MAEKVSLIIRNKNEAKALEALLKILTQNYSDDIDEIIIVDNNSQDNSVLIAQKYNCKIITIDTFTYGAAINIGAENTANEFCVLLSSHVVPVGTDFFKNIHHFFNRYKDAAGLRFCRNVNDVKAYYKNATSSDDPNKYGLLASGSAFRKSIWAQVKFDEDLMAAEDKDWTKKVAAINKKIYLIPSIYFYVNTRNWKQEAHKYKIEKIAHYQIFNEYQNWSFYQLIKEFYRAFLLFINRLKLVIRRFYIDLTFKK